ncbi:ParA family protein [Ectothiorhodospiraceae bacterium 2226]|nr:ParA family protein [Ectothiorhodospiraceae bacterium 2226]
MRRVLVLNVKGGCGKTTIATNIASHYACRGLRTVLMDFDPQASSTQWLQQRPENLPPIHGVAAYRRPGGVTSAWHLRVPPGTDRIVMDAPAGVAGLELMDMVRQANEVVIPVLPSAIDIRASADFIRDLLLKCKVRSRGVRVGLVANRVRRSTAVYDALRRFLAALDLPLLTELRDGENYLLAADLGVGVHELAREMAAESLDADLSQWQPLLHWLEAGPRHTPAPVPAYSQRY